MNIKKHDLKILLVIIIFPLSLNLFNTNTSFARGKVIFQETFKLYPDRNSNYFQINYRDPTRSGFDFVLYGQAGIGFIIGQRENFIEKVAVVFNGRTFGGMRSGLTQKDIEGRREYLIRDGRFNATLYIVAYDYKYITERYNDPKTWKSATRTITKLGSVTVKIVVERAY